MYLGLLINSLMGGERPDASDWAGDAGGPTFPSGHTTSATVFAACCVWAIAPRLRTRGQIAVLCVGAGIYAVTVGLTRVWLGVHWPTDVVGGWLFGASWTALAAWALVLARRRWFPPRGRGIA
jgi:undecaprenyl-diphosphatase